MIEKAKREKFREVLESRIWELSKRYESELRELKMALDEYGIAATTVRDGNYGVSFLQWKDVTNEGNVERFLKNCSEPRVKYTFPEEKPGPSDEEISAAMDKFIEVHAD